MKTHIATTTAQQGDVLLRKIDQLPSGTPKIISTKRMILAEGEVTGHYHGIQEMDSCLMEIDSRVFLDLKNSATLEHQEHGPITLDAGLWEVGRVQEYDYLANMVRPVAD
jgi:hypothetical protein